MKLQWPFLVVLIITSYCCFGQSPPIFKIIKNNKIGYIDRTGKVIIKPVFFNGDDFSEGLAPVRKNGYYGYINRTGKFVIKPKYDLATKFYNGIAAVYSGSNPIFINKKGVKILDEKFCQLRFITNFKVIVKTKTGKEGCVDLRTKKLFIDTVFSSIGQFENGVAIVRDYNTETAQYSAKKKIGVIDTTGKFVVQFGKYDEINQFIEGYAKVEISDKNNNSNSDDGLIDTKGHLLFKRPYKNNIYISGDFHGGLAVISLYKYWIPEKKGILSTSEKAYDGYVDTTGKIVLNDTTYRYANNYYNNRAFLRNKNYKHIIIDTKFKKIAEFNNVLNDEFKNGYAIVAKNGGWGIIDTNANFVIKPHYDGINEIGIVNDYFFFSKEIKQDIDLFGIADLKDRIIVKPVIEYFDRNGFVNGLIRVTIKGRLALINKKGKTVWQEDKKSKKVTKGLNIDYMNRGYFYAYSSKLQSHKHESGGWAVSENIPKKIISNNITKGKLILAIDTNKKNIFEKNFLGYSLLIENTTGDTISVAAQDSRLYLNLQAQNLKGEWKDIEYLPNSDCGNSYHTLKLDPNTYWGFTIPKYDGEIKTKIRAKLKLMDGTTREKEKIIYSNIITGSINPGQFWNKLPYIPNGLMDPYRE